MNDQIVDELTSIVSKLKDKYSMKQINILSVAFLFKNKYNINPGKVIQIVKNLRVNIGLNKKTDVIEGRIAQDCRYFPKNNQFATLQDFKESIENKKIIEITKRYLNSNDIPLERKNNIQDTINLLKMYVFNKEEFSDKKKSMTENHPLNQILYGPPGTGKTYNTIDKALTIIFEKESDEKKKQEYYKALKNNDRKKLKKFFEDYKQEGQIEFITFHQSYGYEEFIEGIKAKTDDGNISYYVKDGVFKKLSYRANNEILYSGLKLDNYQVIKVTQECIYLTKPNRNIVPLPKEYFYKLVSLVKEGIITIDDIRNKLAIQKMPDITEPYILNGYPNIFAKLVQYYLKNDFDVDKIIYLLSMK